MNKGMKTFLTICGIVIGVGLILSVAGMVLGGIKGLSGVEARVPWISFGGSGKMIALEQDTGRFTAVNIDNDLGNVEFLEGDQYRVEINYDQKQGAPAVRNENGTLTVTPPSARREVFLFNLGGYRDTSVKIYYPKGASFSEIKIENDLGNVTMNHVHAQKIDIGADSGTVNMKQVTAGDLKLRTDMGEIKGDNVQSSSADLQTGTGAINLTGAFAGKTKLSCDIGDCTLTTALPKETYAIDAKTDIGDCAIDGKSVDSNYTVVNASAPNQLEIKCSTGSVKVNFSK